MTDDQHRELVDFLGGQFGGVNRRLVGNGSDLRLLAEGVGANTDRIHRLESTMNRRFDAVDERFTRLDATVAGRL